MPFRKIDTAGINDDDQLASALLTYAADSGIAALGSAGRGATASYDYRYSPRLHSIPGGNQLNGSDSGAAAMQLGYLIYLWRPAAGVTGLSVELRSTGYVGNTTVGVAVIPWLQFLSRGVTEPDTTATVATGLQTDTLSVTGLSLDPGALYVVLLTAESSISATDYQWCDLDAAPEATALNGWVRTGYYDDDGTTFWDDATTRSAWTNEAVPYLVETRISGATDGLDGYYDTDRKPGGTATPFPMPDGRLGFRFGSSTAIPTSGTRDHILVWPPIEETFTLTLASSDWVVRRPISYVDVHGVMIREAVETPGGYDARLAPDQTASYFAGQAVYQYAATAIASRPRVYAIAPQPDFTQADSITQGPYRAHGRIGTLANASYNTFGAFFVGDPNRFEDGTSYAQAVYRVSLVVQILTYGGSLTGKTDLDVKLTVFNLDAAGGTSTVVTETLAEFPAVFVPNKANHEANAAYWSGFTGEVTSIRRHSGSDMWCDAAWLTSGAILLEMTVTDDNGPSNVGNERMILVEAQRSNAHMGTTTVYLEVIAAHVEAWGGVDPNTATTA